MKKQTINLISLGCSKNLVDSEKILGQFSERHFQIVHDDRKLADIVIINTCGFINDAKQESIDTILWYAEARKKGDIQKLFVTGCLSQRYREELATEIPEVDAWFGVNEPQYLYSHLRQVYDPSSYARLLTTPSHYAYLKISEGCDRSCSFCAIPMIRGRYHSVPLPALVEEADMLAGQGVKELILIAQDLSYYGRDINGKSLLLPLLEALLQNKQFEWIRLHYLYPSGFPDGLIPLMASEPRICNYLDMPLQHINDTILSSMRRGHNRKDTVDLINRLREQIPGLAIRTTMMVGYPGETKEVFRELKSFIQEMRFERLGVFTYSPEEGTRSYGLEDTVTETEKQKRAAEIMSVQQSISADNNHQRIGKTMRVIVDREEGDHLSGRTEYDSPEVDNEVIMSKSAGVGVGDIVQAKITSAAEFDLTAEIVQA